MVFLLALAVGASLLLLAGLLMRRGVRLAHLLQELARLKPTPVALLEPKLSLVRGRIHGEPLLQSPYQGRDCAYYFFEVLEPRQGKKPKKLASGKAWTMASVADETGSIAVEAQTAVVASPRRFEARHENLPQIPSHLVDFFERAGIDEKHLERLRDFIVHEYTLEPGDEVYVTGHVRAGDDEKAIYRRERGPLIVSSQADVGYSRGLRHELLIYLSTPPLLLMAGVVLVLLAFA